MASANKGEWSEVYALFRILADGTLHAANANLIPIPSATCKVIEVLRQEKSKKLRYIINRTQVVIKNAQTDQFISRVSRRLFDQNAKTILHAITTTTGSSFTIPTIASFLRTIHVTNWRSRSKKDIELILADPIMNTKQKVGFSIKSELGSPPTLLNAGKTTNFIYKVENSNLTSLTDINRKTKIRDKITSITGAGGVLEFHGIENKTFWANLELIDSNLPKIIAELLLLHYRGYTPRMQDLTDKLQQINPCQFKIGQGHKPYDYKIKKLLTDIALGMTPSRIWNGTYDASGGYIVVVKNGRVLCFHTYNLNQFQEYLFKNTKLERAGTNRHDFGKLYKCDSEILFKLNLQIRFIR